MTSKQFHVIRNLLSWIVIALLLLVSHNCGMLDKSSLEKPIGVITAYLAFGFLVMIVIRAGIHRFEEDEKTRKIEE